MAVIGSYNAPLSRGEISNAEIRTIMLGQMFSAVIYRLTMALRRARIRLDGP